MHLTQTLSDAAVVNDSDCAHIIYTKYQITRLKCSRTMMVRAGLWSPSGVHFSRSDVYGAITYFVITVFL